MKTLEQAKKLEKNEVVWFSCPLDFEFGKTPAYQKGYVSKPAAEWLRELVTPLAFQDSNTIITITLSDGDHSGEDCEFSLDDIEEGLLLTRLEYEQLGYPEPTYEPGVGCECCIGDNELCWKDNENNAFVDSKGKVLVTVNDHIMRFKVKYCPNCGRKFDGDKVYESGE